MWHPITAQMQRCPSAALLCAALLLEAGGGSCLPSCSGCGEPGLPLRCQTLRVSSPTPRAASLGPASCQAGSVQDSAQGSLLDERGLRYFQATERGAGKHPLNVKTSLVISSDRETHTDSQGDSWRLLMPVMKWESYSPPFTG